ncbi:MAG TPA: HAD-IA family hydrolase [Candidatus Saccharimonadales bacterium]|nr:HAD-IA family hydrolase [Candidatus Saccharimonadales bacterium]
MITALIMDADGVLINAEGFSKSLARDYNVDPVKEKEFFTGPFQECLVGRADLKESIAPYLPSLGWTGSVDELLAYWFRVEHSIDEPLVTYLQTLRQRSLQVVLATNQERYRTEYMLEHMGFQSAFDKIYSSAFVGLKKPALAFYAKVHDDLGVPKDQILFWDDDPRNIDGARQYGIHAEFYTDFPSFVQTMRQTYDITL